LAFTVHLPVDSRIIPDGARREIETTLQQIGQAVANVPRQSVFWTSMSHSHLQLDVAGFRVVYRIEPLAAQIRVIELQEIPR
jgi:hypothetical protein